MTNIPCIIVSDDPTQFGGVSRLGRTIADRIGAATTTDLPFGPVWYVAHSRHAQLPPEGIEIPARGRVRVLLHNDRQTWGAGVMERVVQALDQDPGAPAPTPRGVILAIQDPDRSYPLLAVARKWGWALWGYYSLDGVNEQHLIGGPARETVRFSDRVAAYGRVGKGVFEAIRERADVPIIPHGVDRDLFTPWVTAADQPAEIAFRQQLHPIDAATQVIGCVAANQPRKDIPLFLRTVKILRQRGWPVRGWLHIDHDLGPAWSVPELADIYGLDWRSLALTTDLSDAHLAAAYRACAVTIGVGRGEGFGYPLVEAQACGVPTLACAYADGQWLVPPDRRIPWGTYTVEGLYGIVRPRMRAADVATMVERLLRAAADDDDAAAHRVALAEQQAAYDERRVWATHMWPWLRAGCVPEQEQTHG